jgi:deazaflavin-dependent oxidoreductase (nitroreductase family)
MLFAQFKRWLYKGDRPNLIARALNRGWALIHSLGIAPNYFVTLEVVGRRSGRTISFPLVMVVVDRERYLVSMLGENASWVRNIRAADGYARLRHGRSERVRLVELPASRRAPILKIYLKRAPGARPHIPVDMHAPLEQFAAVAAQFPVFRVEEAS